MTDSNIHSSYYEKMFEHLFISNIQETAWLNAKKQIEILRAEVDNAGYDLVLECNDIIRHVQLKCSSLNSSTRSQKINIKLANKPNGCVVWIAYSETNDDENNPKFSLDYLFFGTKNCGKLPSLSSYKNATHTKANSKGQKAVRPDTKVIPKDDFIEKLDTKSLLNLLFDLKLN